MNQEEFLQKVGFTHEYCEEMEQFYSRYFESYSDMMSFFEQVFKNNDMDKVPRRMMNQIQRFVSLAYDIDQIRPGRDPLRILFLKTCLESLAQLSGLKKSSFYEYFSGLVSEEGKRYILNHFELTGVQEADKEDRIDTFYTPFTYKLSIADFLN